MTFLIDALPATNRELLEALYAGKIFRLAHSQASLSLVKVVLELLERQLAKPCHQAHLRMTNEEFFKVISSLRQGLSVNESCWRLIAEIVSQAGFDLQANYCDALRLRAVVPKSYESPKAIKAYSPHRDTWFSNSQSQINWWLPLQAIDRDNSFAFYLKHFDRAVPNDSHLFDYAVWSKNIGFQNPNSQAEALYPTVQAGFDLQDADKFSCQAGDIILFSAAHLHQTCPNLSNLIRYSLDFRTVDLRDHESGARAVNADNKSSGLSLVDYRNLADMTSLKGVGND